MQGESSYFWLGNGETVGLAVEPAETGAERGVINSLRKSSLLRLLLGGGGGGGEHIRLKKDESILPHKEPWVRMSGQNQCKIASSQCWSIYHHWHPKVPQLTTREAEITRERGRLRFRCPRSLVLGTQTFGKEKCGLGNKPGWKDMFQAR